jgi:hypothetical protein
VNPDPACVGTQLMDALLASVQPRVVDDWLQV